jgi:hypothetical protein
MRKKEEDEWVRSWFGETIIKQIKGKYNLHDVFVSW